MANRRTSTTTGAHQRTGDNSHANSSSCACCSQQLPFQLPEHIVDDLIANRVIVFAGAGISTEGNHVLKQTLHQEIAANLKLDAGEHLFPDLMERFCGRPNGRIELIQRIKARFENIDSFPDLRWYATAFHRELAALHTLSTIITTNWDTYFETECHATPFITPQDLALFEIPGRKVLKVHGSIANYGSLVMTRSDYVACEGRLATGTLGGLLKSLFATKTVVFCGYSARDEDLTAVINLVRLEMVPINRQHYIVTLDSSADAKNRFHELGLIPIITDTTHFIAAAKKEVHARICSIDDAVLDECQPVLSKLKADHLWMCDKFSMFERPETIFCAAYQDGLEHCLERVQRRRGSGEYSDRHRVQAKAATYHQIRKVYLKQKRYEDVAYIDGYLNGLVFMLSASAEQEFVPPPLFYLYGVDEAIGDRQHFAKHMRGRVPTPAAALRRAAKLIATVPENQQKGIVFDHRAWL